MEIVIVDVDCRPLHIGDNRSRHSPLMLKLNIGDIPLQKESTIPRPCQPVWRKADSQQIDDYTQCLSDKLSRLQKPQSLDCKDPHCQHIEHRTERDSFMLDLMIN